MRGCLQMASNNPRKRSLTKATPVSPPPLRRKKVQSGTTQNAVASFFTPSSQKPPAKTTWQERAPKDGIASTLIVGRYGKDDGQKRRKVAAFDFDSTLISTSSGKKFASDAQDWKWWHPSVPATLQQLYKDGYRIVVISNQGGISLKADTKTPRAQPSKYEVFKTKVSAVFQQFDFPVNIYAATEKDIYRKPRTGMWKELIEDHDIHLPGDLDLEGSIFVGDAGGRVADATKRLQKDFSCSDRNFADNVGIKFQTPEEFFLKEAPRNFTRDFDHSDFLIKSSSVSAFVKQNDQDIVLFCGSPGAGKSTFYWKHLEPLGYARVNQDTLKTRDKCIKVAGDFLKEGKSVAVDNTNSDREVRAKWIELATKHSVPIRCVLFTTAPHVCKHNDVVRALNSIMNPEKRTILPGLAFGSFHSRYQKPELKEGFQDIIEWKFNFNGSEAERSIWTQHWI